MLAFNAFIPSSSLQLCHAIKPSLQILCKYGYTNVTLKLFSVKPLIPFFKKRKPQI